MKPITMEKEVDENHLYMIEHHFWIPVSKFDIEKISTL
jgi:hypothetical protein